MKENHLQLDLPASESNSLVPWIIILVCAAILIIQMTHLAKGIPDSLQQQALSNVDQISYPNVDISANGRELTVTGTVTRSQSRNDVITPLEQIEGVLTVHDKLQVIDPTEQARATAQQFLSQLSSIDVSTISYQPGSTSFTSESDNALRELLALLKQFPEARIRIEGHTDNTGSDSVNVRVSNERAGAVANYLMNRGIPSRRLIVTGYGATQPVANNNTEEGRASNRRIDISPVN